MCMSGLHSPLLNVIQTKDLPVTLAGVMGIVSGGVRLV